MAIFVIAFFSSMIWYASLGPTIPESYSSIMLQAFPLIIGTFSFWDILSRRKYKSPTLIVGAFAVLSCFISLPFVGIIWGGYSVGFVAATVSVTAFSVVFFYIAFFGD
jgi:hypothetical protein